MARSLNIQLQHLDVRSPDELDAALKGVTKAQIDGVVVADEQVISTGDAPRRIAEFALKNRLPSIGPVDYARAGGLLGYGVAWTEVVRGSMGLVDKILKGAKPADLPIQQVTKFELVINFKSAKALGLTIPQTLLLRATRSSSSVLDQRGRLLRAALGLAGLPRPSYDRSLWALST